MNIIDYKVKDWQTSYAMNHQHPVLHSILNKTQELFTDKDRDKIMSRWVTSTPNQGLSDQTYIVLIGLINRADKAMYQAKQKGKDCIIVIDPSKI